VATASRKTGAADGGTGQTTYLVVHYLLGITAEAFLSATPWTGH